MKRETRRGAGFENGGRAVASWLAPLVMVLVPLGASAQTVVTGANDPLVDVPAVQTAVDGGGSVLLVGTFDFGEGGRVLVTRDVDVGGERGAAGDLRTTIRRGEWSFHTPYPAVMPPQVAGPVVSIHDLHFVESRGSAIHLAYSGGCSLHHNVVERMRPRRNGAVFDRSAIVVGPSILGGTPNTTFVPLLVSGDIAITDNVLDVGVQNGDGTTTGNMRGTGMFVAWYVGADVRIERNVVHENTRTGLAILDGKADGEGRGSVVIADNTVVSTVRDGFIGNLGPRAPVGIVTGFNNTAAQGIPLPPELPMIPALITGNTIELHGKTALGIANIWNGAVLTENAIILHADAGSTTSRADTSGGILAATSDQILMHNRFAGEACNAIRLGGNTEGLERRYNVAMANHVEGFQPFVGGFTKCAAYWLEPGEHDDTVVGDAGTAIDDGADNRVTGLRPVKGGVGSAVSGAVAADPAAGEASLGFD